MLGFGLAAFLVLGVALVLVGSNQAELAHSLGLDLARSGLLGASLVLGMGAGVLGAGPLVDRLPRRPLLVASCAFAALAALGIDAAHGTARVTAQVAALGLGIGFYDTLLNVVAVERYAARAVRALALLHGAATAGAVLGPPLVAGLAELGDWTWSFRAVGLLLAALALWACALPLPAQAHARAAPLLRERPRRLASPALAALALIGFAYVGVETAMTIMAVPYATGGLALAPLRGQSAISAFWAGLLAGRAALLLRRGPAGPRLLVACGIAGAAVLGAALALRIAQLEVVGFAAGLALGAIYPLMIALATERHPHAPATAAGLVAGAAALGGFLVPWLAGAVADAHGIRPGLGVVALCCLVIALAACALRTDRADPHGAQRVRSGSA